MGIKKVCILDYGSGNVRSVFNMVRALGYPVLISNEESNISTATHFILPGVGAFGAAMRKIREKIPLAVVRREVFETHKPFLGICVGMQVLADVGYEFGEHEGLGWIPGTVRKLPTGGLPLPHVGWNSVEAARPSPLMTGLGAGQDFYFVHSFVFNARDRASVVAETKYGTSFPSIISRGNIFGVQFHPEKSQKAGKRLINNFLALS